MKFYKTLIRLEVKYKFELKFLIQTLFNINNILKSTFWGRKKLIGFFQFTGINNIPLGCCKMFMKQM